MAISINPLQHAKEIGDLIKKYNDIELYRRIVELEGEILELSRENHRLERVNTDLKEKLALVGKMTFTKPFYLQDGDKQPFCPQCWEDSSKAIHVLGPIPEGPRYFWNCPKCKNEFITSYESPTEANGTFC